jgi:hypothetical protein
MISTLVVLFTGQTPMTYFRSIPPGKATSTWSAHYWW